MTGPLCKYDDASPSPSHCSPQSKQAFPQNQSTIRRQRSKGSNLHDRSPSVNRSTWNQNGMPQRSRECSATLTCVGDLMFLRWVRVRIGRIWILSSGSWTCSYSPTFSEPSTAALTTESIPSIGSPAPQQVHGHDRRCNSPKHQSPHPYRSGV